MLVDIHFHTYVYDSEQLKMAIDDIVKNKVFLCSVTCDVPDWKATMEIVKQSNQIIPMFGIHPERAPNLTNNLHTLDQYMDEALMFGEIGLDHNWITDSTQWPAQEAVLSHFLAAAEKDDKLVMLHTNGGEEEVLELLDTYSVSKVVFHDYDCSIETLRKISDRGYYMTIGRVLLEHYKSEIPNWENFLELARAVPSDLLLTESDGPPRDRRMPHAVLVETINRVAEVRGEPPEEIGELGRVNFLKLLGTDKRFDSVRKMVSQT